MFDISFAELLVFVTGAGLLLGRKELIVGAKYTGVVVGRVIGTLHGLKANYETTSQQTELKTLHNSVRTGLRDLTTVGYDIMSVTPMRMMSSPLGISQQYHSNIPVHNPNIPTYNPSNHLSDGGITPNFMNSQSVQSQSDMSSLKVVNPLDGSTSFITPKVIVGAAQQIRSDTLDHEREATIANQQLARIILAERDLNLRLEYEASNRNTGKVVTGDAPAQQEGGADIVQSVISECIIANTYR